MQNTIFDATQFTPQQGGTAHPVGNFDAQITNTFAKGTKDQTGGMFVVEFTTPAGKIENRYQLWNQSTQAVEIAQKALSALCYSVGIFKISFPNNPDGSPNMQMAGAELRGARCKIVVDYQIDKETKQPTAYVEVKKVLDMQGNEPGRGVPTPQPQQQPVQQPIQQAPQQQPGGWGANGQSPQAPPQTNPQGWSPGPQQNAPQTNPSTPGWSQGPAPQAAPWGQR